MGLFAVSRELLPAVVEPLPVSAPLITAWRWPRQAGPIGSSCRSCNSMAASGFTGAAPPGQI